MNKLREIIAEKLGIPLYEITDTVAYNVTKNWDSVTHLEITSALEEAYGVEFDIDEITAMENVAKIKEILKKHGVGDV